MKKILVVGGRDFKDKAVLKQILSNIPCCFALISGGAKGADTLAEKWAKKNNIKTIIIKPNYAKHGSKKAPHIRNQKLVNMSDRVIAFWNGKSRGTKSTIDKAKHGKKPTKIIRY